MAKSRKPRKNKAQKNSPAKKLHMLKKEVLQNQNELKELVVNITNLTKHLNFGVAAEILAIKGRNSPVFDKVLGEGEFKLYTGIRREEALKELVTFYHSYRVMLLRVTSTTKPILEALDEGLKAIEQALNERASLTKEKGEEIEFAMDQAVLAQNELIEPMITATQLAGTYSGYLDELEDKAEHHLPILEALKERLLAKKIEPTDFKDILALISADLDAQAEFVRNQALDQQEQDAMEQEVATEQ